VIISVGYRVKSRRGTQFRIWATQVLRQHLIQDYTLHQRRLQERGLSELEQALALMARTLSSHGLVSDEGQAVLQVVQRYSRAWRWLLACDEDRLPPITAEPDGSPEALGLAEAQRAIETLRADLSRCGEATAPFGQDNRQALAGILGAIEETFDGQPLHTQPSCRLLTCSIL
jgi:Virulence protein RhuM family